MKKKPKYDVFNDGVVYICNSVNKQSSFKAPINDTSKSDLISIDKLMFKEMSKREQDIVFAESKDKELSLKIKCRYYPVKSNQKAVIEDVLYSIFKIDYDSEKKFIYLYLEKERELNAGELRA